MSFRSTARRLEFPRLLGAVALLTAACGGSSAEAPATSPEPSASGGAAASPNGGSSASSGTGGAPAGASSGGGANVGGASPAGGTAPSGGTESPPQNEGGAGGEGGAGVIDVPPGYDLVWHDEFDVDGAPSANNWGFERGFVRNEEAQWYQAENATVQGGLLVIEARKERVKNPSYTGTGDWKTTREYAEYTSSSLLTRGLRSFRYGRFELRARIPTAAGMWPAWWTLGVSGEWPSNGEIDIMEFYQGKVLANVACGTSTRWQAKWDSASKSLSSLGAGWSSEFHVWRMDWDAQNIVLSLDDQPLNTTALASMLNPDGKSPFEQEHYLLVNLALGGINGGDPSKTTFPQRYEVDYVRVFQRR